MSNVAVSNVIAKPNINSMPNNNPNANHDIKISNPIVNQDNMEDQEPLFGNLFDEQQPEKQPEQEVYEDYEEEPAIPAEKPAPIQHKSKVVYAPKKKIVKKVLLKKVVKKKEQEEVKTPEYIMDRENSDSDDLNKYVKQIGNKKRKATSLDEDISKIVEVHEEKVKKMSKCICSVLILTNDRYRTRTQITSEDPEEAGQV